MGSKLQSDPQRRGYFVTVIKEHDALLFEAVIFVQLKFVVRKFKIVFI